jgi:hypothetical protein
MTLSAIKEVLMLIVRFLSLVAAVVAAIVVVAVAGEWWLLALAAVALLIATAALFIDMRHYTSAAEWLGPSEEAQLQEAGLVESDTGLPKRRRWHAPRAREYAAEVSGRGLLAVPHGWRGPKGAHRVLLVAMAPVSADELLSGRIEPEGLAVLVVVPTLARTEAQLRAGDATEAVPHAETIAEETVASLHAAGVHVSGHIGPADPAVALSDGLRTYDAERVVVARGRGGRYLQDADLREAAETFGVPVEELDIASGISLRGRLQPCS